MSNFQFFGPHNLRFFQSLPPKSFDLFCSKLVEEGESNLTYLTEF